MDGRPIGDDLDASVELSGDDTGHDPDATGAAEGGDHGIGVSPADVTAAQRSAEGKRGRGRPPGSGGKTSKRQRDYAAERARKAEKVNSPRVVKSPEKEAEPVNPDFVSFILMGVHEMASVAFKAQELKLTEAEAKELGAAAARVLDLYNIRMTPEQEAWGMLIKISVMIYYPKVDAILKREKKEKQDGRRAILSPTPT